MAKSLLAVFKQSSLQTIPAIDLVPGQVIVFQDKDAPDDATYQTGLLYRLTSGENNQPLAAIILPLTPVSQREYRETNDKRQFREDPARRMLVQPNSADVRDMGVNPNNYYTIGMSVRKYTHDANIPDRDRIRALPVTENVLLAAGEQSVRVLKQCPVDLWSSIENALTAKFKNDKDSRIALHDDVRQAAIKTRFPDYKAKEPRTRRISTPAVVKLGEKGALPEPKARRPQPKPPFLKNRWWGL